MSDLDPPNRLIRILTVGGILLMLAAALFWLLGCTTDPVSQQSLLAAAENNLASSRRLNSQHVEKIRIQKAHIEDLTEEVERNSVMTALITERDEAVARADEVEQTYAGRPKPGDVVAGTSAGWVAVALALIGAYEGRRRYKAKRSNGDDE